MVMKTPTSAGVMPDPGSVCWFMKKGWVIWPIAWWTPRMHNAR